MKMTPFQTFIHQSKYARWRDDLGRRENWTETVDRWWDWMLTKAPLLAERSDIRDAVLNLEVMPSMRALMTAGPAADRDNTSVYNCSYLELDSPIAMAELLYVLMNGTGVGYSVERRVIDKWSPVPEDITRDESVVIQVKDSKAGWADAVKALLSSLMGGVHPTWDVSGIRPAGARLKTFGGRASGPGPLEDCLRFITNAIYNARGRSLRPIEVHDMACVIANSVIVGGVRRSAMISLSDLDDHEMARAKSGNWWESHSYRSLANNSAVYTTKPEMDVFMEEWLNIYRSYSGERGIFNREAAQSCSAEINRESDHHFGTNPCGEITLRPMQFCNLTEVVVRPNMDPSELCRRVEIASIIGTVQSKCTYFPYLRKAWNRNSEEERLLGVSLTGIQDNRQLMFNGQVLSEARRVAKETNITWADKLGIRKIEGRYYGQAFGYCVVSCRLGIWYSSSLFSVLYSSSSLRQEGSFIPPYAGRRCTRRGLCQQPSEYLCFEFVIGYDGKETRGTATDMMNDWAFVKNHWTDHNPSVTIEYRPEEFMEIGSALYGEHWDIAQGLSFLPRSEHVYKQAPYEAISKLEYTARKELFPDIDWSCLTKYEEDDNTKSSQTFACSGNSCEIVDIESSD